MCPRRVSVSYHSRSAAQELTVCPHLPPRPLPHRPDIYPDMPFVQFQPLASQPTPSFWSAVNTFKLDRQGLDDTQILIHGWLEEGRRVVHRESGGDDGRKLIGFDGCLTVGAGAFGNEGEM